MSQDDQGGIDLNLLGPRTESDHIRDRVTPTPYKPGIAFVPQHYAPYKPIDQPEDWISIADAYHLGPAQASALKYLLRAGRKEDEPYGTAITKAIECLARSAGTNR